MIVRLAGQGCPNGYTQCGNAFIRQLQDDDMMFAMDMEHIRCCNDLTEICVPDQNSEGGARCIDRKELIELISKGDNPLYKDVAKKIVSFV